MAEAKKILRIRLSLKGRPVRSYSLDKGVVTIGRSPDCEIVLDNTGISREHLRIEATPQGHFQAVDLGSANGTLLNDKPLGKAYLSHDDQIQIGKFTLRVGIEDDRRGDDSKFPRERDASQFDNTTVMSTEELRNLIDRTREEERRRAVEAPPEEEHSEPSEAEETVGEWEEEEESEEPIPSGPRRSAFFTAVLISFLLGTAAGAGAVRILNNLP
jgi:pSer/pThr/pTyr-binding forkhead associated (FHA) protein